MITASQLQPPKMEACQISVYTRGAIFLLLLLTGSVATSASAKASDKEPVNKLVAAAQSVLQQAKKNISVTRDDDLGLGRHKGDSFTSPVDGYFIQVRIAEYAVGEASMLPIAQADR